jgi:hypothetical protein
MVTINESVFLIGGFIQYTGYVIDIIKLNPTIDIKTNQFIFQLEFIETSKSMEGRMFANINVIFNYLVIFGGSRDGRTLNDLWIINTKNWESSFIETDLKFLYPRCGASSSVLYEKDGNNNKQSARLLIYGGTFWWNNTSIISGVHNELCLFKFKFSQNDNGEVDVEKFIPLIYGRGSKRVFCNSFILDDKMYIWGGLSPQLLNFKFPDTSVKKYTKSLNEYKKDCKKYNHIYLNFTLNLL